MCNTYIYGHMLALLIVDWYILKPNARNTPSISIKAAKHIWLFPSSSAEFLALVYEYNLPLSPKKAKSPRGWLGTAAIYV